MPPKIKRAVRANAKSSDYDQKNLKPTKKYIKNQPGETKGPFKIADPKKGRLGTVQKRGQSGICINSPLCEASKSYMFNGDLSGDTKIIQPYVNDSVAHYYDDTLDDPFTFDLSNDSYVIGPPLDIPMGAFIQCKDNARKDKYYVYQGNNEIRPAYYAYLESSANALYDEVSDCSKFTEKGTILDLPVGSYVKCGTAPINGLPGPNNENPKKGAIQHNNKYSWKNAIYQYQGRKNEIPLIQWIRTSDIGASLTYNKENNTYKEKAYNDKPIIIDCENNNFYRDSEPSTDKMFAIPKDVKLNYPDNTFFSCSSAPFKDPGVKDDLSGFYDFNTNIYVFKKDATTYDTTKIKKESDKFNIPGTLQWIPSAKYYKIFVTIPLMNQNWDNPIVINCNENKIPRDTEVFPSKTTLYISGNTIYRYNGYNSSNDKIKLEIVNGTNVYFLNSDYFGINPIKQFEKINYISDYIEIVTSTDVVADSKKLNSGNYFKFSNDNNTYNYGGFEKHTNTNRIYMCRKSVPDGTTPFIIPGNYGGWIVEDGFSDYRFNSSILNVIFSKELKYVTNNWYIEELTMVRNSYQLQSVYTGMFLYFGNESPPGTLYMKTDAQSSSDSLFLFIKTENNDSLSRVLINRCNDSKKVLNHFMGGEGVDDVHPIDLDSSDYSKWNFIKQSDDTYVIQNVGTAEYIEVPSDNKSRVVCKSLTVTDNSSNSSFKWKLTKFNVDIVLPVV
jgi:hypothetical protein